VTDQTPAAFHGLGQASSPRALILSQTIRRILKKLPLALHQFSSLLSPFFFPLQSWGSNGHLSQKEVCSANGTVFLLLPSR